MSIVAVTLLLVPLFLVIPVLLGVYTYRDAKRRGMNAPLWALVAALAPTFLGFLIYLLVRGSHSDWKCPRCGGAVEETYVVCPRCGARLKASCPRCGAPVEAGWKVCPQCAASLEGEGLDITPPVKPRDKALGKILAVVILIPVAFLVLLLLNFGVYSVAGSSGVSHTACYDEWAFYLETREMGLGQMGLKEQALQDESKLWAVVSQDRTGSGEILWTCLLYLPHTELDLVSTGETERFLHHGMEVAYTRTDTDQGVYLVLSWCGEKAPKLTVTRDGKQVPWVAGECGQDLSLLSGMEGADHCD